MVENELDTEIALRTHFNGRTGETCSTHILNGDNRTRSHQLKAGFQKALLSEWIANLNGWALFFNRFVKFSRCHRCTANAITARLGTEIDNREANALGFGQEDAVMLGKASRECIDEDIAVIALVEVHFAANGRNAESIAITANARHDARYEVAGLWMVRLTETQGIHGCNWTSTHCENVAQNATNACRRALIRLDIRRVVMAFHLEDDAVAIANVNNASVFTRTLDNA